MNTPTISNSVESKLSAVNNGLQVAPLPSVIGAGDVADPLWDRKRLLLAREAAGIDRKTAVAEYNAALTQHRAFMKADVAAVLSQADAVVTRKRFTKTGKLQVTIENHASKRIARENALQKRIEKLTAELAAVRAK